LYKNTDLKYERAQKFCFGILYKWPLFFQLEISRQMNPNISQELCMWNQNLKGLVLFPLFKKMLVLETNAQS